MGSWSTSHPASSTTPVYMTMATFTGTAPATTSSNGIWSSPVIVAQNGTSNGNLCYNSAFDNGLDGWTVYLPPGRSTDYDYGVDIASSWYPIGGHAGYIYQNNAITYGYSDFYVKSIPVVAGNNYEYQAKTGSQRCNGGVSIFVSWYNSSDTFIGASTQYYNNNANAGGNTLASFGIIGGFATAPTGAVTASLSVRKYDTLSGQSNSFMPVTQVLFASAPVGQTTLSLWSPTASQGIQGSAGTNGASARHMFARITGNPTPLQV